jgi:hypothetical protein
MREGLIARRLAGLTTLSLIVFVLLAGSVAQADPPGNNGTVKIHEGNTEAEPIRRNEPHVCTFHIHGFGFDSGQVVDWHIKAWPPTGDGKTTVLSGSLTVDAAGDGRDPAVGVHSLEEGHYKLFWKALSAPGGFKQKVFWVECVSGATTSTTSSSTTSTTLRAGTTSSTSSSTSTTSSSTTSSTAPTEVLPTLLTTSTTSGTLVTVGPGQVTTTAPSPPETLPFTGGASVPSLAGLGVAGLALGAMALAVGRRRGRHAA